MVTVDYRTVLVSADSSEEEILQHDLSVYRGLGGFVVLDAKEGSGSALDVYLESRDWDGNWIQRWHAAQLVTADSVGKAVVLNWLSQETVLTSSAQTSLASAALAAGEVRNGYFPPPFRITAQGAPSLPAANVAGACWRWRFDITGGTGSPSFTVRVGLRGIGLYVPYSL